MKEERIPTALSVDTWAAVQALDLERINAAAHRLNAEAAAVMEYQVLSEV